MLRIAIVENDADQSSRIDGFIKQFSKENEIECETTIFVDGIDFISDYKGEFDAVFMDIDMPMMDGLTASKKLREVDEFISIVFITNLAQYAINGYEVSAMDYLLKPVEYSELCVELKKITRLKLSHTANFIWIAASGAIRRVPLVDIKYIEIIKHDVYIHTKNTVYSFRGTLKDVEHKLSLESFSRCHNCYIVNLRYVTEVEGDILKIEPGGESIFISRNRKKKFMEDLTSYVARGGGITIK